MSLDKIAARQSIPSNTLEIFEQPAPPPAVGMDAELYTAYRDYVTAQTAVLELDDAICRDDPQGHEIATLKLQMAQAEKAQDRALARFLNAPALTFEGLLLKLKYSLDGQDMPTSADDLTIIPRTILSVIADIQRMSVRAARLAS